MALIHCNFFSQVLGLMSAMSVILPDPLTPDNGGDKAELQAGYPTLYLLHGMSDDHTVWQRRTSIERYVQDKNLAVVMPAVHRSFYTNTRVGQRYWTFISEEIPALARSYFPLSERRDENYVAGLSMGGYGAFKMALAYPTRFAAAASLSGALDVVRLLKREEKEGRQEYRHIFGEASVLAGSTDDLFFLAEQSAKDHRPGPALYQWCGTEDFLYEDNVCFRDHARELELDLDYFEGPGAHEWACWDAQIQQVLTWLPGAIQAAQML